MIFPSINLIIKNSVKNNSNEINNEKYFFTKRKKDVMENDEFIKTDKPIKIKKIEISNDFNIKYEKINNKNDNKNDEIYYQYGFYRNSNGEWERDETVEFDSDDEIIFPPDYIKK